MHGRELCYHHGGKTPRGIASASFKHGRTSKYLPARLHEKFDEAYHDPNWRSLRQEIAVTRTRIKELMEKIDQGDASTLWQQLAAARAELAEAQATKDIPRQAAAVSEMLGLIDRGAADAAVWRELDAKHDTLRRLVETEMKSMVAAQQVITVQQAMTMVAALVAVVREHVTDRKALAAIQDGVTRILNVKSDGAD